MEFNNHLTNLKVRPRSVLESFVLLLAPFAPHIAEELWHALGHTETLAYEPWPAYDSGLTKADTVEVPVQINGKVRERLVVPAGIDKAELERLALADDKVKVLIAGKQVRKVIVVPGRLVNLVVG
jgi:leucyl-tRNA synthetase